MQIFARLEPNVIIISQFQCKSKSIKSFKTEVKIKEVAQVCHIKKKKKTHWGKKKRKKKTQENPVLKSKLSSHIKKGNELVKLLPAVIKMILLTV